jgi:hypothetical protein
MKCLTSEVERATLVRPKNIPHYTINKLVKTMGKSERSEASWAIIVVRVRKSRVFCDRYGTQQTGEQSEMNTKCQKIYRATRPISWDTYTWRQSITMDPTKLRGIVEHCNDPSTSAKELLG